MSFYIRDILTEDAVAATINYIDNEGGTINGVQSVVGTTNQITAEGTKDVQLSLPSNVEIDNLALATSFQLQNGAGNNLILTSDADGNGTWQIAPGGLANVYGTTNEITATPDGNDITLSFPDDVIMTNLATTSLNTSSLRLNNGATVNYVLTAVDTDGNAAWRVVPSASGVQSITGTTSQINVSGDNTLITLSLPSNIKINGVLGSNNATAVSFSDVASAANYVNIASSATTPTISITGSGTNVDLQLSPKGSGTVIAPRLRLTSGANADYVLTSDVSGNASWQALPSPSGVQTITGTTNMITVSGTTAITLSLTSGIVVSSILNSAGTANILSFANVSSAANYVRITNAANGSAPIISATGASDTNIDLQLSPGGTGAVVAPRLRLTSGANADYVLTSDVSGNASWQALPSPTGVQTITGTTNMITVSGTTAITLSLTSGIVVSSILNSAGTANILSFDTAPSATNNIKITNAANGSAPIISAIGATDTNVDIELSPKNNGAVVAPRLRLTSGATDNFVLTSDASGNGTWQQVVRSITGTTAQITASSITGYGVQLAFPSSVSMTNLHITGTFQLDSIDPILSGYVLTSDTSGNGTWQSLPSPTGILAITGTTNEIVVSGDNTLSTISLPSDIRINGILGSNNATAVSFSDVASAANYVNIASSATTPTISITGSGTNVDLQLSPGGTGAVVAPRLRLTSGANADYVLTSDVSGNASWQALPSPSGVQTITGTTNMITVSGTTAITLSLTSGIVVSSILNSAGTANILSFDTAPSATNNIKITNAANGSAPEISTIGTTDTNVDLQISLKGSGTVIAPRLRLTSGATDNFVLTSDASGNGTWQQVVRSITGTTAQITASSITGYGVQLAFPSSVSMTNLHITGTFQLDSIDPIITGYVLTTDASGNGTWQQVVRSITGTTAQITATPDTNFGVQLSFPSAVSMSGLTLDTFRLIGTDVENYVLTAAADGTASWAPSPADGVQSITGTTNQISITGTATAPIIGLTSGIAISSIINSNTNNILTFSTSTTPVNYIDITNADGETAPTISAKSLVDTNVDLQLTGQGALGTVIMPKLRINTNPSSGYVLTSDASGNGTWSALPVKSITGTTAQISVSSSNGDYTISLPNIVQINDGINGLLGNPLLTFTDNTNAVNNLTIQNSATGGSPIFSVDGEDNIDLTINAKGSGTVILPKLRISTNPTNGYALIGNTAGDATWQILPVLSITGASGQIDVSVDTSVYTISLPSIVLIGSGFSGNNGNITLVLDDNTDAVNRVHIANSATTLNPIIRTDGTDTNINLELQAKGTGGIVLTSNATTALLVDGVASAVNYINISNNTTGNAPIIEAVGTDDTIDLTLTPKGITGKTTTTNFECSSFQLTSSPTIGYVLTSSASGVGTWQPATSSGVSSITGTTNQIVITGTTAITVSLADNVLIQTALLASNATTALTFNGVSSAVNYINIANSALGSGTATISAVGGDNNIDLVLTPKGTGKTTTSSFSCTALQMTTTPTNGYVLTCDASGNASWKANPTIIGTTDQITSTATTISGVRVYTLSLPTTVILTNLQATSIQSNTYKASNGTTALTLSGVTAGANYINIANSAAGTGTATISATGADTNINLELTPKGAGITTTSNFQCSAFQLTTSPTSGYVLTANASGVGTWQAPSSSGVQSITGTANQIAVSGTTNVTVSLPPTVAITNLETGTFKLGTTTTSGYVLTANGTGTGSWQPANSIAPYLVGTGCTYTTIQSAIDAANVAGGGNVYVKPGTYTENLVLYEGVNVIGFDDIVVDNGEAHGEVQINGTITINSLALNVSLQHLSLVFTTGNLITLTSEDGPHIFISNCNMLGTSTPSNLFLFGANCNGSITLDKCSMFATTFFDATGGGTGITFTATDCQITAETGAYSSSIQNLTLDFFNTTFEGTIAYSGLVNTFSFTQSTFNGTLEFNNDTDLAYVNTFNCNNLTFTGAGISYLNATSGTLSMNLKALTLAGTLTLCDCTNTINIYDSNITTLAINSGSLVTTINAYNSIFTYINDVNNNSNVHNYTCCSMPASLDNINASLAKTLNLYNCSNTNGLLNNFSNVAGYGAATTYTRQASHTLADPSSTYELIQIIPPTDKMIYINAFIQGKADDLSEAVGGTAFGVFLNSGGTVSLLDTADYVKKHTNSNNGNFEFYIGVGPYIALKVTNPSSISSAVSMSWSTQLTYQIV